MVIGLWYEAIRLYPTLLLITWEALRIPDNS